MTTAQAPPAGRVFVRATGVGTVVFAATAVAAAASRDARGPAAAVAIVLFAVGTVAFLAAYLIALARSRTDAISVAALFFLTDGTAPPAVRRWFMGALGVQVVVAVVTASVRPYTSLAYGILVPVFGLGMAGLWGARHGRFGRRDEGTAAG